MLQSELRTMSIIKLLADNPALPEYIVDSRRELY
jgi:hypothetical protein